MIKLIQSEVLYQNHPQVLKRKHPESWLFNNLERTFYSCYPWLYFPVLCKRPGGGIVLCARGTPSCWRAGSPRPSTTSSWVPIPLPHQLVRMSRAMPRGSTPVTPSKFEFSMYSDLLWVCGKFPAAHSCSPATAHPCRPFSNTCLLPFPVTIRPICSSSRKCFSSAMALIP